MAKEEKKTFKGVILQALAIFLGFVVPISLLAIGIAIFKVTDINLKRPAEKASQETVAEEVITPSTLLNNRAKYSRQRVVIRGRTTREPAVCERKECPADDSCCGCPEERNLILNDSNVVLTSNSGGRLRLLDEQKQPLCQRRVGSCEYNCGEWKVGAIYDVTGNFFGEAPPPGWKMSLEYYFLVEDKSLVRTVGILDTIGNLFNEIKAQFQKLKTTGSYVL